MALVGMIATYFVIGFVLLLLFMLNFDSGDE